jgi:hypothetical protein
LAAQLPKNPRHLRQRHHSRLPPGGSASAALGSLHHHSLLAEKRARNEPWSVWWHLHEEITSNHRCQKIEELFNLAFNWFVGKDIFEIELSSTPKLLQLESLSVFSEPI